MNPSLIQPAASPRALWLPPARMRQHAVAGVVRGLLLAAIVAGCTVQVSADESRSDPVADATKYIQSGDYRLLKLVDGDLSMDSVYAGLDRSTGVPVYTHVKGLDVTQDANRAERRYVDQFNATMTSHFRRFGLPESSRKKWVDDLSEPARSFKGRMLLARKSDKSMPATLSCDADPLKSPDGHYTLSMNASKKRIDGKEVLIRHIIVRKDETQIGTMPWNGGDIDLFWGPVGSDTAYMHWIEKRSDEQIVIHASIDLRVAKWIAKQETK